MMNREQIEKVQALLDEVSDLCTDVIIELDLSRELDSHGHRIADPVPPKPSDYLIAGSMRTGALRRRSLDLTRALAEMRRS